MKSRDRDEHISIVYARVSNPSFLSIIYDGTSSHCLPVVSGVPQGSVLGPLLFITYINDVATCISSGSDVNMFADDIALYRVIRSAADYVHLQEDVDVISDCIQEKDLQFNANNAKLLISRKRSNMHHTSSTDNSEWCNPG